MRDMISEAKIVFAEEFRRAIKRRSWLVITAIVPLLLIVAMSNRNRVIVQSRC